MSLSANNLPATRPFVLVNMSMTADGKIATANRAVHSFGSPRDLRHLYELRATADAVMCGARTVEISRSILDNGGDRFTRLRVRQGLAEHNLRVIVTGSGSIDLSAPIFRTQFSPIIVLTTERLPKRKLVQLRKAVAEVKILGKRKLNFPAALRWLRTKWGVKRLLCEGGGELNAAMFQADLVDEIHLTICPMVFGGRNAPTIAEGQDFIGLAQAKQFKLKALRRSEGELFTVFNRPESG
jgi:riboflavin-specific deaminase-like protein